MKTFLKWAAGMLEDQQGAASSKRAGFYWAFALLTYMIVKSANGAQVNMEMFWAVVMIILAGYGLITSEYFKGKSLPSTKSGDLP
ncbi:MAG: hypothetical protein ACOYNC_17435 [Bacteroidales bacterium]